MNQVSTYDETQHNTDGLVSYPIEHWTYSSLTLFLRNAHAFKKKFMLRVRDEQLKPSTAVGRAAHDGLGYYFKGVADAATSIELAHDYLEKISDIEISYSKTSSREKMRKELTQVMNFYFQELPTYKVMDAEESHTAPVIHDGIEFAIPVKAIFDLVADTSDEHGEGAYDIIDHKFVATYTEPGSLVAKYIIQAMTNYYAAWGKYGRPPRAFIARECKKSKNADGSAQTQEYSIVYDECPQYFTFFIRLLEDATAELMRPDKKFLPNFDDLFDGELTLIEYMQEQIGSEQLVTTEHKTAEREYVEPKYVQSKLDKPINQHLSNEEKIKIKLGEFGISVDMRDTFVGPNVTKYTLKTSRGTRMDSLRKHKDDIAQAIAAQTVRIEAPIPGTDLVGIEVPNKERTFVSYVASPNAVGTMLLPMGVDVYGQHQWRALDEMPHLLVAGATGAGKSVFINVCIKALTDQLDETQLQLVLVDPKMVELTQWDDLPHLMVPTITDEAKALKTMLWLVKEMNRRYAVLKDAKCRDITRYNEYSAQPMTRIVCVIDEFADLMLSGYGSEFESAVKNLAQKARGAGIHIILGTQRPSVDVVTGVLKANLPTRIAFMTSSQTDSRVILDESGAELLTGKGDALLRDPKSKELIRLQAYNYEE